MKIAEGVIKFMYDWKKRPLPSSVNISELVMFRNMIARHGLIGAGMDGISFGNISIRFRSAGRFIISGSDTGRIRFASKSHFTLVENIDVKANFVSCRGVVAASSESMTHDMFYRLSPEIKCVIHVHNMKMWKKLINKVPATSAKAEYGTPEMAYEIKRLWQKSGLKEKKILVMSGHPSGLFVFGESIVEAFNLLMDYFSA